MNKWKDKTCEDCVFRKTDRCYLDPAHISVVDKWPDTVFYRDACSHWTTEEIQAVREKEQ